MSSNSAILKSVMHIIIVFMMAQPSVASAKIRVGYLGAFSGNDPNTSNELYRGAQAYLEVNKSARDSLELEKLDTKGQIRGVIESLDYAVKKGIKLFVGIANSDEAIAAAKYADEHGVIYITPFATNEKVTQGRINTFQACFNDRQQGKALARFAKGITSADRIAVLTNELNSYSTGLSEVFKSEFNTIRPRQFSYSNADFEIKGKSLIEELKALSVKVVFIPDHILRASVLAKIINKELPGVIFLGGDGFGGKKMFLEVMGGIADTQLIYSTHWSEQIDNKLSRDFSSYYRRQFADSSPTTGAALSYDAMQIL